MLFLLQRSLVPFPKGWCLAQWRLLSRIHVTSCQIRWSMFRVNRFLSLRIPPTFRKGQVWRHRIVGFCLVVIPVSRMKRELSSFYSHYFFVSSAETSLAKLSLRFFLFLARHHATLDFGFAKVRFFSTTLESLHLILLIDWHRCATRSDLDRKGMLPSCTVRIHYSWWARSTRVFIVLVYNERM